MAIMWRVIQSRWGGNVADDEEDYEEWKDVERKEEKAGRQSHT
jgi:hypothetical protein